MKVNMGKVDRALRAVIGLVAIAGWPLGLLEGAIAVMALVVGLVLVATAVVGWCPPYALFGINTGARGKP